MTGRHCVIDGCDRPPAARLMCNAHYQRWRRQKGDGFDRRPVRFKASNRDRLPATPLLDAIDAELRRLDQGWQGWARAHGIHPRYLYRWRTGGTISIDHVDLVCDALGVHPVEVYGDHYYTDDDSEVA